MATQNVEIRLLRETCCEACRWIPQPAAKAGKVGWPMLSARNIENNRIVFDEFFRLNQRRRIPWSKTRGRRIQAGDVLLTIVGTIGRTAVVAEGTKPFALQRSVAVLTPKSNVLSKIP
jgi:type I restriction enzyme S subunit